MDRDAFAGRFRPGDDWRARPPEFDDDDEDEEIAWSGDEENVDPLRRRFSRGRQDQTASEPPRYDYSLTREWKFRGLMFEYRWLQSPSGRQCCDCQPSERDIEFLRDRAERLGRTIVLETPEPLSSFVGKFGMVPGIILIAKSGEEIWRAEMVYLLERFIEMDEIEQERTKWELVFGLCRIKPYPVRLGVIDLLISREFYARGIGESSYADESAEVFNLTPLPLD